MELRSIGDLEPPASWRRLRIVTDLDQRQARAGDRLDFLNRIADDMSEWEARLFTAHLLGTLSMSVTAADWDAAVAAALRHGEVVRSRRDHPSAPPDGA